MVGSSAANDISSSIGTPNTQMPFAASSSARAPKTFACPPRSPNLNAFAERFVRSIKEECLRRMIFVGQASLRHAINQFMVHYHAERNHQGLGNRLLRPISTTARLGEPVKRRRRLGGMLSYYYREAA
ncbi:hypothetical protein P3T23_002002 [Paraburkholderia sp. GAS448]